MPISDNGTPAATTRPDAFIPSITLEYADALVGNDASNTLHGYGGDDFLDGDDGDDTLEGRFRQ